MCSTPARRPHQTTLAVLVIVFAALFMIACDDDDGGDDPRDIITGDTSMDATVDTTPEDTGAPDTTDTAEPDATDTTEPGDLVDVPEDTADVTDTVDATDVADTTDAGDTADAVDMVVPVCGDGVLDTGEVCDGDELDGQTCGLQGFASGTLACNTSCDGFDTAGCVAAPECGNGQIDDDELCDGSLLDGATCESEGFGGGTLGCSASCATYDTTGCTPLDQCGNGQLDGTEVCDGAELDAQTCLSQGFDGGALGCASDCTGFDTTSCTTISCGNGTIDPGEDCEGFDFDGETCESLGFGGGTLNCTGSCTFNTAVCDPCGNGIIDGDDVCDGDELAGENCQSLGFDSGALACGATCGFDTAGCVRAPYPQIGEVIITEVMQNPMTLSDAAGEWFELYNTTSGALSLNGCTIAGNTDSFGVLGAPTIAAGGFLTFAVDSASGPGFAADVYWTNSYGLANTSDAVHVLCPDGAGGDRIVDVVLWDDGATFPDPDGASMQLDPGAFDATANGVGSNWCESTQSYNGDLGTPGAPNDNCIEPLSVDFCRLQFPTTIVNDEGATTTVYGRVYIAGLTDQSTGNDTDPRLVAELGYGTDGTDPATDPSWVWQAASPNAGYTASGNDEDEYESQLTLPAASGSPYDFAYRFSGDGGQTWTLCDSGLGSSDGYAPADAGDLTVNAATVAFFSEYVEGSSDNKALEIYNAGSTSLDLSTCNVAQWFNGSNSSPTSLFPTGILAPGDVYVMCNPNADPTTVLPACDETFGALDFNGDDTIVLTCGTILDVIGLIGEDPGSQWGSGDQSTADNTLRRRCAITVGDGDAYDVFDPATEWDGFTQDTFGGLGTHATTCP